VPVLAHLDLLAARKSVPHAWHTTLGDYLLWRPAAGHDCLTARLV
jgi:hypothetical protein